MGQMYLNKTERQSVVDESNKQTTLDERHGPKLHRPSSQLFKRLKVYTAKPMIKNTTRTEALNSASHANESSIKTKITLPGFQQRRTEPSTGKKIPQKEKLQKSSSAAMLKKHNEIRCMTAKTNMFGMQNAANQPQ